MGMISLLTSTRNKGKCYLYDVPNKMYCEVHLSAIRQFEGDCTVHNPASIALVMDGLKTLLETWKKAKGTSPPGPKRILSESLLDAVLPDRSSKKIASLVLESQLAMLSPSASTKFAIVEHPPKEYTKKPRGLPVVAHVAHPKPPNPKVRNIRLQAKKNKLIIAQPGEAIERNRSISPLSINSDNRGSTKLQKKMTIGRKHSRNLNLTRLSQRHRDYNWE